MARAYAWVEDAAEDTCAACARAFGLLVRRRHHCRRCGRLFCDACSACRLQLGGASPDGGATEAVRLCTGCAEHMLRRHGDVVAGASSALRALDPGVRLGGSRLLVVPAADGAPCDAACDDELEACPVCMAVLVCWAPARAQRHVDACMCATAAIRGSRYTVFEYAAKTDGALGTGPANSDEPNAAGPGGEPGDVGEPGDRSETDDIASAYSALESPGTAPECPICYVAYAAGDSVALLNCLCRFHEACIADWFARGNACPFHP